MLPGRFYMIFVLQLHGVYTSCGSSPLSSVQHSILAQMSSTRLPDWRCQMLIDHAFRRHFRCFLFAFALPVTRVVGRQRMGDPY